MEIMFYEAFFEEARLLRRLLPPEIQAEFSPQTIQASRHVRPPAGLISIRTQSVIPPSWAEDLSGVFSRSAGFDHLQQYRSTVSRDIPCGYLNNYCARAVAEQAVLLMMALLRKLPLQSEQFDTFNRDGLTGQECRGRRALVVGVGNIGSEIVDIVQALGMEVRGVDLAPRKEMAYVALEEGLSWAQVIFCALPLTEETRGLFNYRRICANEQRPVIVNIARGEITPLADLERLLGEKLVGGVGLDVFPDEQLLAESLRAPGAVNSAVEDLYRLKTFGNVIFTPHNAFNTEEALMRKCEQTVDAVSLFLAERRFPCQVTGCGGVSG